MRYVPTNIPLEISRTIRWSQTQSNRSRSNPRALRRRKSFAQFAIEDLIPQPLAFRQIGNALSELTGERGTRCNRSVTILNQNRGGWHATSVSGAGLRQGFSRVICVFRWRKRIRLRSMRSAAISRAIDALRCQQLGSIIARGRPSATARSRSMPRTLNGPRTRFTLPDLSIASCCSKS